MVVPSVVVSEFSEHKATAPPMITLLDVITGVEGFGLTMVVIDGEERL